MHYIDVNWGQYEQYRTAPHQFLFANKGRSTRMGYGPRASLRANRNHSAPPWGPTRMLSLSAILAALFGFALAVYMVLYLPAWAALGVALGAVALVAIGGGALLAKGLVLCALVVMAARFMRRRER